MCQLNVLKSLRLCLRFVGRLPNNPSIKIFQKQNNKDLESQRHNFSQNVTNVRKETYETSRMYNC